MNNEELKDRAEVWLVPPLVPVITILMGVGLQRLWPLDLGFALPAPGRYWAGGVIVVGSLLGLGLWSVILFRHSGQSVSPWTRTPEIVERGPFRITRNPMYLQMVLACIGFSVILSNLWILALTPVCGLILQASSILPEEAYLEKKFGEPYLDYKRRVRRWL